MSAKTLNPGQILTGTLFNEPMRVETVRANGPDTWIVGLVGTQSERFRSVTLTSRDIEALTIFDVTSTYDGDGRLLRLGLQAYSLGIAYEFDPYFGLSRMQRLNLSSELLTVETRHLRGVIWRLGSREFQMYAYLTDLSWESNLFKNAKIFISKFGEEKLPSYLDSGEEARIKSFMGSSGSWLITGNPFFQVHISDLGLIEAHGLWIKKELPKEAGQIKKAFSSILDKLDEKGVPPEGQTKAANR
jgi:hypothetical protein